MHIKLKPINRRRFLRCSAGGLGTAIALPALEAMFKSDKAYAAGAAGQPRFVGIYQPNGHQASSFSPRGQGRSNLDFSGRSTAPLEPHILNGDATIFRNFQSTAVNANGNHHLTTITSYFVGRSVPNDDARQQVDNDGTPYPSIDSFLANHYEQNYPNGRSQHLVLEGSHFFDGGRMNYNNEQKSWVSTDMNGNKIPASMDIRAAFDKMFEGFDPGTSTEQRLAARTLNKSVVDAVLPDCHKLMDKLGAADRQTVGSYCESIYATERQLAQPLPDDQSCSPGAEGDVFRWANRWEEHINNQNGHRFIDLHWRDTMNVLALGFQCEAIRSVAYMLETEAGESPHAEGPNGEPSLNNHHGLSHNPTSNGYGQRDARYAQVFADVVQLFKDTPVGDGNLLDQSIILWGAGIGVNHSKDQLMAVLAGHGGSSTINHGAVRDMNNQSFAPMMRTLLTHMGVIDENQGFGSATGPNEFIDLTS